MGKKILVVDDEEELLALIDRALSAEGFEVTTVTTAEDAVERAKSLLPDLILIDIVLPDMEGPEAVRELSGESSTKNIPVIFLSGIVTREQEEKASSNVRVGDKNYRALSKPFSSQELLEEIQNILGDF